MRLIIAVPYIPQPPPPPAPPAIPQPQLSASPVSSTEIDLLAVYAGPPAVGNCVFEFSTNAGGPFTVLATQASFLFKHTGRTPGVPYFYRCDIHTAESPSRTSAYSPIVSAQTVTPSTQIKWDVAHYMMSWNINGTGAKNQSEMNALAASGPAVAGYGANYRWGALETAQGVYDFSPIVADFNYLQSVAPGKRFAITLATRAFGANFLPSATVSSGFIPNYVLNNPLYGPLGPNGTQYGYTVASLNGGVYTELAACLWRAPVMARKIALFAALANSTALPLYNGVQYTFDTHPLIEAIIDWDESALSMTGASAPPADYSAASYKAQIEAFNASLAVNWPHTNGLSCLNYTGPSQNPTDVLDMVTAAFNARAAFSGPDVFFPSTNYTWAQQALIGMVWNGTTFVPGGTDLRGKMPVMLQVQQPDYSRATPANIYTSCAFFGASHIFWTYQPAGQPVTWLNDILPVINAHASLPSACPTAYAGACFAGPNTTFDYYIGPAGSDANPGTQASPWALTALNTKRALYAGKKVGVLPGTYNCISLVGGIYANTFSTPAFSIAGGTASAQTVIQSTVARGAILDAGANSTNNAAGQPLIGTLGNGNGGGTAGLGYITIDGFTLINCFNRTISIGAITGAPFTGTTRLKNVIVQHNYCNGLTNNLPAANTTAITLYACDGAHVWDNRIGNISDTTARGTAIEIWTSINCITEFNTTVAGTGGQTGGFFHKNSSQANNTIRYNFADLTGAGTNSSGCVGMDSDGDGTTTSSIYGNIFVGDQPVNPAVIVTGGYPNSLCKQLWFNNTFSGIPGCSVAAFERFGAPGTITFYNNIVARSTVGGRGDMDTSVSALALADYNCYPSIPSLGLSADGTNNYPTSLVNNLPARTAALPAGCIGKETHSKASPPLFQGTGVEPLRFQLQSASVCKGSGSTTGQVGGAAVDMGAYGIATQVGCSFPA